MENNKGNTPLLKDSYALFPAW